MTAKLIAVLVASFGFTTLASAAPITWVFEGRVTLVFVSDSGEGQALFAAGVSPGSLFSGQLVFDSAAVDRDPDPARGYFGAMSLSITVGSFHQEAVPDNIEIYAPNESAGFFGEVLATVGRGRGSGSILEDPGFGLQLPARAPGQVVGDALPLFPPGLDDDSGLPGTGFPEFYVGASQAFFEGSLSRIVRVPEAGAGLLLALSLAAGAGVGRRSS